jgi:hypothetical protein
MPPGRSQYEIGNVGRDAIVLQGEHLSVGLDEEKLVDALAAKGLLQLAETVGLQRRVIINLAQHCIPAAQSSPETVHVDCPRAEAGP